MRQAGKRLCAAILVLCMLVGVMPVGVPALEDSAVARFVSQQLSLGDDLTMHFWVSVDAAYVDTAVMTVTVNDSVTGTYVIKDTTPEADGTYKFSVKLAAAQMTDVITLTLTSGDVQIGQKSYTVRDYAIAIITGSYTNETKALAKELLNYGAKAQTYFGYNQESLANDGYELESMAQLPTDVTEMIVSDGVEGIAFYGASMVFENKLAVRYYFTAANGVDGYAFTVGEAKYTAQEKGELYYIEVPGINPQDMDKTMELTVSGESGELKVGYSPLNYFVRMYNKQTTGTVMKELVQAAYSYHRAAAAYVMGTVYTVSFSDGVAPQQVESGACAAEPAVPVKTGYSFLGWYNGDVLYDFSQPVKGDISLIAQWRELPQGMWYDFGSKGSAEIWTGGAVSTSWLESYDGAQGVLKIESTEEDKDSAVISAASGEVWCAPASVQILADQNAQSYGDIRTDKVFLYAAKNEYETGQIIVSAKKSLSFTVSVSELTHTQDPNWVIGAEHCTVYIQKYAAVTHNQQNNGEPTGLYPDALLPQENAIEYGQNRVESGNNGGAWLSFFIPNNAEPGDYIGTATVTLEGTTQEQLHVPVMLTVYDVTVPEETGSKSLFTINTTAMAHYEQDSSVEMHNQYIQFLVAHRLAPSSIPTMTALGQDGDSDMRVWAKTVWYWYEKGLRTVPLKTVRTTENGYACLDMELLEQSLLELSKLSLEKGVDLVALAAVYDYTIDEPFYVAYSAEHIQHNIDSFNEAVEAVTQTLMGMSDIDTELGQSILGSVKEVPHIITDYYGNAFRLNAPMVFMDGTTFSYEGQNVALCPKFDDYCTPEQRAQYDLLGNEEKWWYGCNTPSYPYPSYHTDDTPVSAAAIGWMMAQYGITGNLYWVVNYAYKNGVLVDDPYTLVDWGSGANGDGIILYPGKQYAVNGPVGSVRMCTILDGNEDYELIGYIQAEYESRGMSIDGILQCVTSTVYDGTRVYGGSKEFEEARRVLLYIAQAAGDGLFFTDARIVQQTDGTRCYSLTQSDGITQLLTAADTQQYVGSGSGTANWRPAFDREHYTDAIALTFRVKVEGTAKPNITLYGQNGGWKSYGSLWKNQPLTGFWQELTLTVDVAEEYESISQLFLALCLDTDTVIYIDQITAVYGCTVTFSDGIAARKVKAGTAVSEPAEPIRPGYRFLGWYDGETLFDFTQPVTEDICLTAKWEAYPENMWNDFSDPDCADVYGSPTKTWLESYEGAEGVLKIDLASVNNQYVGDTNGINWPAVFDKTHYENAVGLSFRVRIESTGLSAFNVYGQNWEIPGTKLYDAVGATNSWKEYTIAVDVKENYSALNGMFWVFWANSDTSIYIDQITVLTD